MKLTTNNIIENSALTVTPPGFDDQKGGHKLRSMQQETLEEMHRLVSSAKEKLVGVYTESGCSPEDAQAAAKNNLQVMFNASQDLLNNNQRAIPTINVRELHNDEWADKIRDYTDQARQALESGKGKKPVIKPVPFHAKLHMNVSGSSLDQSLLDGAVERHLSPIPSDDNTTAGVTMGVTGAAAGEVLRYLKNRTPTQGMYSSEPEVTGQGPEKSKEVEGPH